MNSKGMLWERHAESHLRQAGLVPLIRNFRCRFGEIDLVMLDGEELVFIEVRYRQSSAHGDPLETITHGKQQRLARAAALFLQDHPVFARHYCRFDAVGITGTSQALRLRWIKGAFSA